jgi:hypothetical protein
MKQVRLIIGFVLALLLASNAKGAHPYINWMQPNPIALLVWDGRLQVINYLLVLCAAEPTA